MISLLAGNPLLHTAMAVEELGGWQDSRPHDGPRHRHLFGGGEKTKEKTAARLPLGEPQIPQLVGVQVLPVRVAGLRERGW